MSSEKITTSFAGLREMPCWGVKRGHGSFLTFEFGDPRLIVREPIEPTENLSPSIRKRLARRHVSVAGEWHLWIYCCDWTVFDDAHRIVGDSSTPRRVDRAASFLNGRKLMGVTLAKRGARTAFVFDLGGRLETAPYDRKSEQWTLYEPNGHTLTLRADRRYSYLPGSERVSKKSWLPIAA